MPEGLRRYYGHNHLHFITFSCYHRLPLLAEPATRTLLVQELARVHREYGFLLAGYVVMPEHVHLLIGEPKRATPSTILKMLKQRISHKMKKQRGTAFDSPDLAPPAFWQARFYDFNVFTTQKKSEKLEYMHGNPVTRGLVLHPRDWPWSSWSNYAQHGPGLIAVDLL
jgi:putative transposase